MNWPGSPEAAERTRRVLALVMFNVSLPEIVRLTGATEAEIIHLTRDHCETNHIGCLGIKPHIAWLYDLRDVPTIVAAPGWIA